MASRWITVPGVVTRGFGVASGSDSTRFPGGTIRAQLPYFRDRGVDLSPYHPGTLNVDIAPRRFTMIQPSHTLTDVSWWPGVPAETFSFSPCRIVLADGPIHGLVYYPHPETKPEHHHPPTVIEILAPFVEGISTGNAIQLQLDRSQIDIS
jgi:hypothetical protein